MQNHQSGLKLAQVLKHGLILTGLQVAYERVNLADIETSSEEDDYGDLFAHVSHNIFELAKSNEWKMSKIHYICAVRLDLY